MVLIQKEEIKRYEKKNTKPSSEDYARAISFYKKENSERDLKELEREYNEDYNKQ